MSLEAEQKITIYEAVLKKILELNYPGTMKDFAKLALENKLEIKDGSIRSKLCE